MNKLSKIVAVFLLISFHSFGQFIDASNERVKTPLNLSYKKIGTLKTTYN